MKKQILFLLRYVWSLLNHFQLRRRRRFATYLVLLGATQDKINFLSYWLRIEVRLSPMCHCRRCQNTIYSHLSALSLPHPQSLLIRLLRLTTSVKFPQTNGAPVREISRFRLPKCDYVRRLDGYTDWQIYFAKVGRIWLLYIYLFPEGSCGKEYKPHFDVLFPPLTKLPHFHFPPLLCNLI